ncbi:MAG: TIGR03960 family B12-binding radical SAM protein [Spirochaetes bacterium]|nr:MAG: TIGR03960 family B12-binding radical SAM protein [Spirochaetota bacterium]
MSIELEKIEKILPFVSKPGRYIGGELNQIKKARKDVDVTVVLSYPDIYEVGMSNSAIQILYSVVNNVDGYICERVFAPWLDFEKELRNKNLPLFSIESYTPLDEFDILGFSIGYEMLYTNMLNIMDLGKIPLFSKDRDSKHPLVIAGGPGIYNPEPIADFIDVFVYGDGENAILEFLAIYKETQKLERYEQLKKLNSLNYCYIPSLHEKERKGDFVFTKVPRKVKRKIEPDLDKLPYPDKPIVPIIKTVQDRITIETTRGCTTGCRFCQAGFIYRPVRERSINSIDRIAGTSISTTGYDEVSLAALSISDYSELYRLVRQLTEKYSEGNVSISLPSLRVNSTSFEVLKMIQKVRKSSLTFAIESPDEDVRKRINKMVDDEQLLSLIDSVSGVGWRLIKLYFMIGLPMATKEGIKIENFIKKLMDRFPKLNINVNVSLFVPKPHTPFERVKQMDLKEAEDIISYLRSRFQCSKVRIKYQNPKMSKIEAILSRGDRNVGSLIYSVFKAGERFSSWDEVFNYDLWVDNAKSIKLDVDKYLGEFNTDNELPWDIIDVGVSKKFLRQEFEKAKGMITTENCIYGRCPGCGVCDRDIKNTLEVYRFIEGDADQNKESKSNNGFNRYRNGLNINKNNTIKILCRFKKSGLYKYFSHLDLINLFIKVGRRAKLPFSYTEGFNPKPRIVIPFPLPLGVESEYELMEIKLDNSMSPEKITNRLNKILPEDLSILDAKILHENKSIASKSYCHDYFICSDDAILILANLNRDMIKKADLKNNSVLVGFDYVENGIIIRLFGNLSLKKVFNIDKSPEMLSKAKRTKIWEVIDQKIHPFI